MGQLFLYTIIYKMRNNGETDELRYSKLLEATAGNFKAFLYDCDGTLADNMQAHKDAYVQVAKEHGIDLDPALIDELAGWPTVTVVAEMSKRYGVPLDPAAFAARKSKVFVEEFIEATVPIPFVVRHLKEHAGKARIGVVTGGSRATVTKTLQVLGIFDLVEVMACAGDTERGKPFPDPFLLAADKLGVSPEACFVFEDGEAGVKAAEAAGMKWVRVDRI